MNKKQPLALNKERIDELRRLCKEAEKKGSLSHAVLKIIFEEKWFKLFLPKAYGGLELDLPEALRYEEQLAYIDGSLGWTITLCAGANLFAGYIHSRKAASIFSSSKVCFGGSGAVSGVAAKVKGGYIVNGFWRYATGAPHLTHFTANCTIEENGQPLLNKDNSPVVRSFFFNKKDVIIHEDWNTMGLIATAGHSFSVKDLKVSLDQSFIIDAAHASLKDRIYQYPFMPLAESTIAVNTLGMTRRFMELALEIVKKRQHKIGDAAYDFAAGQITKEQQKITQLAGELYQWVQISWDELISKGKLSGKSIARISGKSRDLVNHCRTAVTAIYPYCGLAATNPSSDINRVFRDIFTGSQHGLLTFKR
ncbi:acyl-CoA dehydrogenase [Niabella yanshanensis]|uniref:Acyl-CoA dehydrogenase n=1 Tax=Niabella yanshanensis TaxID=577386 RepID=A0ABZ0W4I7_9BACT|nr:acyl-CoA dehydrogenase family protein [Niabella yanshanensis]WQD37020.1 acyl-CoA dehydrogenase [Niabella yanshanensis]